MWCRSGFAQLALFPPGRAAMLEHPAVTGALEALRERGMSEEARNFASAALMALRDDELQGRAEGDKHVMLSYQWDAQRVIERLNNLLQSCGYLTWFDLTNMKGERLLCRSGSARAHTHVCEFGRTTRLRQFVSVLVAVYGLGCRIDHGCDERCDRGSRRDVVRSEPGVQGICQLSVGGKLGCVQTFCLVLD